MVRKILVSLILVSLTLTCFGQATIERVNKVRYEKEFANYVQKQKRKKLKRFVGYSCLGVGAVGTAALIVSAVMRNGQTAPGGAAASVAAQTRAQSGFWPSVKEALKQITIYSLVGGFATVVSDIAGDGYSYLKSMFASCSDVAVCALRPYAKRLGVELERLHKSMTEMGAYEHNQNLTSFYRQEVIGAFLVLVPSLEKFGAVMYWHMRNMHRGDEVVLLNCRLMIDRLFLFCDNVAKSLEDDFHAECAHFSSKTFEEVEALTKTIVFLSGNYTTLSTAGG